MADLEPVRFSRLKLIGQSPAHYLENHRSETGSMRKGTGTHSFLIGDPDSVVVYEGRRDERESKLVTEYREAVAAGRQVVVYEGTRNKRAKAYQEFLAEHEGALVLSPKEREEVDQSNSYSQFLDDNPDKLILSPAEYAEASAMRKAIEAHPRAVALLDGVREQTLHWDVMGRACRGTPDVVHIDHQTVCRLLDGTEVQEPAKGSRVLVELKTTKTAHPDRFKWEVRKRGYHAQCSWYRSGIERAMVYQPGPVAAAFIVAVESSPPYPVTVFNVVPESLDLGWRACRGWLETLLVCERSGHFPAYTEADVDLDLSEDLELDWEAA